MKAETEAARPSATACRAAATCSSGRVIAIFRRVILPIIPMTTFLPTVIALLASTGKWTERGGSGTLA